MNMFKKLLKKAKKEKNECSFSENNIQVSIKRTNLRPFYDSTWEISIENKKVGKTECFSIVRMDDETISELMEMIKGSSLTKENILMLDQKNVILYD